VEGGLKRSTTRMKALRLGPAQRVFGFRAGGTDETGRVPHHVNPKTYICLVLYRGHIRSTIVPAFSGLFRLHPPKFGYLHKIISFRHLGTCFLAIPPGFNGSDGQIDQYKDFPDVEVDRNRFKKLFLKTIKGMWLRESCLG
jgi:hypothetical protein